MKPLEITNCWTLGMTVGLAASLMLAGCGQHQKPEGKTETNHVAHAKLKAEAGKTVQYFGKTLKGELQEAMGAGGAAQAVDVCHTRSPEIAGTISRETDMQVSRVSLKNRNPVTGVPPDWQAQTLKDFESQKAAGTALADLIYSEIVGNEYRFMKAIPTGDVCLVCHGTDIDPDLTTKITSLYPTDKATGYKKGDIRGAFVVTKNLNKQGH